MIQSMTGYGRVSKTLNNLNITIELRSLNSKFLDVRLRLPNNYRSKEIEIRKILMDRCERGKLELNLDVQSLSGDDGFNLNKPLFKRYIKELSTLSEELGIESGDLVQSVLRIPNMVNAETSTVSDENWTTVQNLINECIANFQDFRKQEGVALEKDLVNHIHGIKNLLPTVEPHELERIAKLRQRLHGNLQEYLGRENVDENRFEQEILFYLEKMDINEEKVRLSQHCDYFLKELEKKNTQKGRKLSFIAQEIGREINTLGAKAYSHEIQRIVVMMKDELEKIKEQISNIL